MNTTMPSQKYCILHQNNWIQIKTHTHKAVASYIQMQSENKIRGTKHINSFKNYLRLTLV